MEKLKKPKNKENLPGTVRISSIFKVKKCLFEQTLYKITESNSPKSGQQVITESPTPAKLPKSSFEDSPFSLLRIKKRPVLKFKNLSNSSDSISCSVTTTPTHKKNEVDEKEVSPKNTESDSPKSGQQVTPASCTPLKIQKSSFSDSPFSLFRIKKKRSVFQSKVLSSSSNCISCTLSTTPTNKKSEVKQKEEVSTCLQSSKYIQSAVQKSILNPDLIGDFSKPCALPIIMGRHPDLKTISPETMASLLHGPDTVNFSLIDCRYPYEFKAGHIQTAQNVYIRDSIVTLLLSHSKMAEKTESKEVIIFYCEFSSERGPSMETYFLDDPRIMVEVFWHRVHKGHIVPTTRLRHLRNIDRDMNQDCYPFLYYPELYILEGGYKAFFASYKELCEPQDYKTMLDKDNSEEFAFYKKQSKSLSRRSKCPKRARSSVLF